MQQPPLIIIIHFARMMCSSSMIIVIVAICTLVIVEGGFSGKFGSNWIRGGSSSPTSPHQNEENLKASIANFYDKTTGVWLDVWGDDLHHGYYPNPNFRDHKAAQRLMIENSLKWGFGEDFKGDFRGKKMVDVGCGVGGSSRYIVHKYGGSAVGLSLSPFQIARANELSSKMNLSHVLKYHVADAMNMPFEDNTFDLTWSMESGEHMPDKEKFMNELFRVTAPDGRIIVVTWCHRELKPGEESLQKWEVDLLSKISKVYFLPNWVAPSNYVQLANKLGLHDVREVDWTEYVEPFWPAVIRSALNPINFLKMVWSGSLTFNGAIASFWMRKGLKTGVIKFALITGKKK